MEDQGDVQHFRLQFGIGLIRAEQLQEILRRGQRRIRAVDIHASVILIMVIRMIAVYREQRELRDELDRLAYIVLQRIGRCPFIIGSKRQDAPCHGVHDVLCGRLHDHISCKILRQFPRLPQDPREFLCFLFIRIFAKQEQIRDLFKAELSAFYRTDQCMDIISPIPQFSVAGFFLSILFLKGNDLGDPGQPGQYSFSVLIAQTAVHPVFFVHFPGYPVA